MNCRCGNDLGAVSATTHGLCPQCGESVWLQVARTQRPDTAALVRTLTASGALVCEHGQNPCIARCCVRYVDNAGALVFAEGAYASEGHWEAIPEDERQAWFERVFARKVASELRSLW